MGKLTKKTINASYTKKFEATFKCPICEAAMHVSDLKSLICENNHTYDFAKQGYLNLLAHAHKVKYSRELFAARNKIIVDDNFFAPLTEEIVRIIETHFTDKTPLQMLDAGCGEGSHLVNIFSSLKNDGMAVGLDISKEAILEAAKSYENYIWAVADLVQTPFRQAQFDVILNILSPANNLEFNRLLAEDGIIIKVVPRSNYLKEIREQLYKNHAQEKYSNQVVVDHFKENFTLIDTKQITYTKQLNQASLKSLLQMTPLAWDIDDAQASHFSQLTKMEITVDLMILVGKKKVEKSDYHNTFRK